MKRAVREVENQEELETLLATPAYSQPPPTVIPRTKPCRTHEEMARRELEMKAESQRQRMLGNDPFAAVETSGGSDAIVVPPLMIVPRPSTEGGGGGSGGGKVSSLLDTFEEGENEEYNKAGAWEKEYRQNDRLDRRRPTLVRFLK